MISLKESDVGRKIKLVVDLLGNIKLEVVLAWKTSEVGQTNKLEES